MTRMTFVNLPVSDLAAATRFYEALGCAKNPQFSDDKAASMAWSDQVTFQLLTREYYATFTSKPIADAHAASAMLIALSFDSRAAVDSMIDAAAAAGGDPGVRETMDLGWLYNRAVADPDGHVFELAWMDMSAMGAEPEAASA